MFDDAVGGLWPYSHQWMVEASALKNAVTAFEVYLEKGLREVIEHWSVEIEGKQGRHRPRLKTPQGLTSPMWKTMTTGHSVLGSTVATPGVVWARDLRHLLTHQNGELRVQKALDEFRDAAAEADADLHQQSYVGGRVHLGINRVVGVLDALAAVVRHADVQIHNYGPWGRERNNPPLDRLAAARCLDFIPE
ncbi:MULTISPECIES: hypothetical protein [unclassified Streptomyces]|uniref:hypothetical protein n=1 Tax=unclassified Streptomyces TaxID=2593676 RepID=UPI002E339928|nr:MULTISPECIES: hypothetical protein [unclassified Streptomyces]WUC68495.1 hypothetical protein OG861_32070 [Streptomyces sp. NBC_00539]